MQFWGFFTEGFISISLSFIAKNGLKIIVFCNKSKSNKNPTHSRNITISVENFFLGFFLLKNPIFCFLQKFKMQKKNEIHTCDIKIKSYMSVDCQFLELCRCLKFQMRSSFESNSCFNAEKKWKQTQFFLLFYNYCDWFHCNLYLCKLVE